MHISEEGKWLLSVTSFKRNKSGFDITNENISFAMTTPGHLNSKSAENFFNELNKII